MSHPAAHAPVVLLGDTLFMTGVEMALIRRLSKTVVRLRTPHLDLTAAIAQLQPSLLLFDLDDPQADAVLPFLKSVPNLRLIGLDRSRQIVQVLSCQRQALVSMDDLAEIIQTEADSTLGALLLATASGSTQG